VEVGVVPLRTRVNAGVAVLSVVATGYAPFEQRRELAAGEGPPIEVFLAKLEGRLSVAVRPANARIVIDDRVHTSPMTVDLEPGAHQLRVEAPSHRTRQLGLELVAGETRRLEIVLDREPTPLLKNPWFWTGAIAVAAAALATTFALTHTRSPDQGSLGTAHVP
jgi:hypothetical protein